MLALRVTGPGAVGLSTVPVPRVLPGEVLLRPLLVGVCGTDAEIIAGHMAYFSEGGGAYYPITLGHEWVGEVVDVGDGTSQFGVGDRVVGECSLGCGGCATCMSGAYHRCAARRETGIMNCNGAAAEFLVFPARSLHRVSPSLPLRAAALVEPTAVAYNAVTLARVGPASTVAIMGDGPIGLLLLLVARAFRAQRVVVVGADTARLALALSLGADAVVDVRACDKDGSGSGDVDGVSASVVRACGRAPDVVLEASGNAAAVHAAVACAAAGAAIIVQGLCGSGAGPQPRGLDLDRLVVADLTLRGALGSPGVWPAVISLIESGAVDPARIVTHELPLRDYAHALELVRTRAAVKLLLRPGAGAVGDADA